MCVRAGARARALGGGKWSLAVESVFLCEFHSLSSVFSSESLQGKMEAPLVFLGPRLQIFSLTKPSGVPGSAAATGPRRWHLQVTAEECSREPFVLRTSVAALFARR